MREDMYKVIVERPRRTKEGDAAAARLRRDFDGPMRLGMRAGYGYRNLNENLAPLRRYLRAQLGRPWSKVFSEICTVIDRRNTVQQHIHRHIRDFIAIDVEIREGGLVDPADRRRFLRNDFRISQELYVDPRSGLIRINRDYRAWRRDAAAYREREAAEIASRRRPVDDRTLLLRLDGIWYRVEVGVLPTERVVENSVDGETHRHVHVERRYDVVLRRPISRAAQADLRQCKELYGSTDLYGVSKRQISTREIKVHHLR
ncbi:MAG: hypothetical protein WBF89_10155 [Steroidobacteraceae bacterium]|jgi:hypothetical protein